MLQLVLGLAGTGKTTHLLGEMRRRAGEGRRSWFLVPEQFSSSAETLVLRALGEAGAAFVDVVSFRTLAGRVLHAAGAAGQRVLSDAARAVFVRRAAVGLEGRLTAYAKAARGTAFCNLCAQTITELKTAGASPEALATIAEAEEDEKLADLALLFAAYEASLEGAAVDPVDRVTLAARYADEGFFAGSAAFIDAFDGFTPAETLLLGAMLRGCEGLTVALCCGGLGEAGGAFSRFSPVRATAQRLLTLAGQNGVRAKAPLLLAEPRRTARPGLLALGELLAGGEVPAPAAHGGLWVGEAPDAVAEVKQVAAMCRSLALEGVPYSRMAVVCRQLDTYETLVRREFALFDVPLFADGAGSIEYASPVRFLRAALALLARGLHSEGVLVLAKSGLCGCKEAELAALDNYVYTWRPGAAEWRAPFEKHPAGLLKELGEEDAVLLGAAEGLRGRLVPAIEAFRGRARGVPAAALAKQLYLLLDAFDAPAHSEERARLLEAQGDFAAADALRRSWDLTMDLLDQMAALLGDERVEAAEFDELFLLTVRSTEFGQAPQALESVVFTSADRMRLDEPDWVFVLGAAEGEFPKQVGYSGLLTHADRDTLVRHGVEMPGAFFNRTLLEEMFFYRALTAARVGLWVTWPARRGGTAQSMSAALEPVLSALAPPAPAVGAAALAATPRAAFDRLGGLYRQNSPEAAALYAAVEGSGEDWAGPALALLDAVDAPAAFRVESKEALGRLVGQRIRVSPTRADRFFTCRFSYFMERVLRVQPRSRAEFSPLESGTFVHAVLEGVLRGAGAEFGKLADDELRRRCHEEADRFVAEALPDAGPRTAATLARVKNATFELLRYLRDWAKNSEFTIDALELDIGEGGEVPPLRLAGPEGELLVGGKVDRVDVLRRGGKQYLCILDYKTGTRSFDLSEVYYGQNIQMLLYMHVLCREGRYKGAVPAGMLYLGADPAPTSGTRRDGDKPVYKLDGLLVDDAAVAEALEGEAKGLFLPVRYNKDGSLRAGKALQSLENIGALGRHVERLLAGMARELAEGSFPAVPLVKKNQRPCDWCAYRAACRHEAGRHEQMMEKQPADFALREEQREEEGEEGQA